MGFWRRIKAFTSVLQGHSITAEGTLGMRIIRGDGRVEDLGIVSRKKVTVSFVNDIVDALQGAAAYGTFNAYKSHDYGTGTTAEANTQTGLITPCGEAREVGTRWKVLLLTSTSQWPPTPLQVHLPSLSTACLMPPVELH